MNHGKGRLLHLVEQAAAAAGPASGGGSRSSKRRRQLVQQAAGSREEQRGAGRTSGHQPGCSRGRRREPQQGRAVSGAAMHGGAGGGECLLSQPAG